MIDSGKARSRFWLYLAVSGRIWRHRLSQTAGKSWRERLKLSATTGDHSAETPAEPLDIPTHRLIQVTSAQNHQKQAVLRHSAP
jgi:hypothetical protein